MVDPFSWEVCPAPSWPSIRYGANHVGLWWTVRYDLTGPPPFTQGVGRGAWFRVWPGDEYADRADSDDWRRYTTRGIRLAMRRGWHLPGVAESWLLVPG